MMNHVNVNLIFVLLIKSMWLSMAAIDDYKDSQECKDH